MKTKSTPSQECKAKIKALTSEFQAEFQRAYEFAKQQKTNLKVFKYLVYLGVNADTAHRLTFCKSAAGLVDLCENKLLGDEITDEDYFDINALIAFS